MFGSIGGAEILIILVLALLLFGPRSLPKVGRNLGRAMSEFRRATNDFRMSLEREVEVDELKRARSEIQSVSRELKQTANDAAQALTGSGPAPAPTTPDESDRPGDEQTSRKP